MITVKTWRDPYESGFSPTKPKEIEINPGLTVLVGCNGAGKTTLLYNIKDEMKRQNIPCYLYDNLKDGGSSSVSEAIFFGNTGLGAALWASSEGEAIKINFGHLSLKFKEFLQSGFFDTKSNRFAKIFKETNDEKEICNKRVLLFDAVDSGLSVDSIIEIKEVFHQILKEAKAFAVEVYIIISANEYELARNTECFDVNDGKYIKFDDYESYRTFIIISRKKKEKRIEKQAIWFENKKKKEEEALARRKAKYEPLIAKIKDKAINEGRELNWREKDKIRDYERLIYKK